MTKASDVFKRVGVQLMDEDFVRWTLPELAAWLDEAVKTIAIVKPSACSVTSTMALARGTRQTLPVDQRFVQLLDVVRNMNVAGAGAGGRAIRPTTRAQLDGQQPRWHDPAAVPFKQEVRQFVFDETLPMIFYTYPGNDGTGHAEIVVSQLPPTLVSRVTDNTDSLGSWDVDVGLRDEFDGPLLEYVLYRAFDKEDPAAAPQRSATHYQAFAAALGIKTQVEASTTPNRRK